MIWYLAFRRLNSRRGASLPIAVIFFLLCLSVGAVALTAASVSTGRLVSRRQTQQDDLTVSSAARLLRDTVDGLTFQSEVRNGVLVREEISSISVPLRELIQDAAQKALWAERDGPAASVFHCAISISGLDLDCVTGQIQMDSRFNLTATVSIERDGMRYCPMVLTVPAEVQVLVRYEEDASSEVTVPVVSTTVTWGRGKIAKE